MGGNGVGNGWVCGVGYLIAFEILRFLTGVEAAGLFSGGCMFWILILTWLVCCVRLHGRKLALRVVARLELKNSLHVYLA